MKTHKTLQFKISNRTNKNKLKSLEKLRHHFKKLVNFSLHKLGKDKKPSYESLQRVNQLNSAYSQIAKKFAEEQYKSYKNNETNNKFPRFSNNINVSLDERVLRIKESDETKDFSHWAKLSLVPYQQINLPILSAESQIEELKSRDFDFQKAQLIKKDDWYLHVTIEKEVELPEDSDHFVGVDLGINNSASVSVLNKSGEIKERKVFDKPFSYDYFLEKLNHIEEKIAEFQSKNLEEKIDQFYEKRNNFVDDYLHKLSRKIVDFADQYSNSVIVLEKLKNLKNNCYNKSKKHNKRLDKWIYRKLINFIQYKAHFNEIRYQTVNPAFTSQVCTHCFERSLTRRSSNVTQGRCQSCKKVVNNMDLLASVNLVRRLFFYKENKSSYRESSSNKANSNNGFTEANQFGFVKQLRCDVRFETQPI